MARTIRLVSGWTVVLDGLTVTASNSPETVRVTVVCETPNQARHEVLRVRAALCDLAARGLLS